MSFNKKQGGEIVNHEGYKDPTADEAISRAERKTKRYMPLVYVCSPFSGDEKNNMEKAKHYSRQALDMGYIPVTPHIYLPLFMSEAERELAMFIDIVLLSKCSQLWVFGNEITEGMAQEINWAEHHNMLVRRFKGD